MTVVVCIILLNSVDSNTALIKVSNSLIIICVMVYICRSDGLTVILSGVYY